jgi:translation initiation factor 3 subunit B
MFILFYSMQPFEVLGLDTYMVFVFQENLQKWLTDDKARDQLVIRFGHDTEVYWNDARQKKPEPVHKRSYWTESYVQWSPIGTYLVTLHKQGAAVWGGADTFTRLMRYQHSMV